MELRNFAQLKRELTVGTEVVLTYASFKGCDKLSPMIVARLNKPRKIVKQQTNAVKFDDGSYLGLGSMGETAKDFKFFGNNTFTYQDDDCTLDYKIIK